MPPRSRRRTIGGRRKSPSNRYRSGYEETVGSHLESQGVPFEYETERLNYTTSHQYKPDFIFTRADGSKLYLETKGYFTGADRTKTLAVLRDNPGIDLRFLFLRASNKLNPGSKTTYGQWCDKQGIPWAEGDMVPKSWLADIKRESKK